MGKSGIDFEFEPGLRIKASFLAISKKLSDCTRKPSFEIVMLLFVTVTEHKVARL